MADVTQEDRDAFIAYENARPIGLSGDFILRIHEGSHDDDERIQAFARHRLATRPAPDGEPVVCAGCEGRPAPGNNPCAVCGLAHPPRNDAVVEALRGMLQRICEMQAQHYGNGLQTHLKLAELAGEARAQLAALKQGEPR